MPVFQPDVPVDTREPAVLVEGPLPPGRHVFRLVVEDNSGLRSAPAHHVVVVLEPVRTPIGFTTVIP